MVSKMNKIVRKYVVCLVFSFDLFVLVWLSEILRNMTLAISSGWSSGISVLMLYSALIFFLFVFLLVPSILLAMWLLSPIPIRKLLVQFGLTEKSLDKKKESYEGKT